MKRKLFSLVLAVLTIVSCLMFVACKPEEAKKYTVSFETFGGTVIESQIVEENKKITRPADPERTNDLFYHWYLDNKNIPFDFDTYKVKGDITLKVRWAYSSTVTYKVGDEIIGYQQVTKETYTTKPLENPTKEGITFVYWRLDGQDEPFNFNTTKITNDITLKARFLDGEVQQGQIKYYLGVLTGKQVEGINSSTQLITAQAGDTIALPVVKPVVQTNEFYGWVNATTGEQYLLADYEDKSLYSFVYDGQPLVMYALGKVTGTIV
ncbi:MAG: hypothetical protein E7372_05450 [Clostridiales bacterium]|nr:hypothetical protein [Clostridiales bacterium]